MSRDVAAALDQIVAGFQRIRRAFDPVDPYPAREQAVRDQADIETVVVLPPGEPVVHE